MELDVNDVSPAIHRLVDWMSAARWSSPQARERGLRRLVVAARGSRAVVDEREFSRRIARLAIQTCVPTALRAAAQRRSGVQRERLLHAAELCEREPTRRHALQARRLHRRLCAHDAATYAAYAAANASAYASRAAAYGIDADAPAYAARAAYYAAASAAHAAYAAATHACNGAPNDATARAAYDDALTEFAERVVQVLVAMGSPGTADLTNCDAPHMIGVDVTP